MTHKAETILAGIKTLLTGLTTTGNNISRNPVYAWAEEELPALSVNMGPDTIITESSRNDRIYSQLQVRITAHCAATQASHPDTTLNQIRLEVTQALMADHTLGVAWVIDINEQETSEPEFSGDTEVPRARQTFNYAVNYVRDRINPQ